MTKEGALDRDKMRALVFSDESARHDLNAILHPAIYEEAVKQRQLHAHVPYTILAIPLLDKSSPYITMISRILVIDCDEKTQIKRVKARSNLDENQIKRIIQAQTPRQARLTIADDLIENDGNIEELEQKIVDLHQKYMKTCIVNKTIS